MKLEPPALIGRISAIGEHASSLAVVLAILYGIGFIIVTAYLGQYGVVDFNPLRPRYVAAALPFLAITLAAGAISALLDTRITPAVWARIEQTFGRRAWPPILLWAVVSVGVSYLAPALLFVSVFLVPAVRSGNEIVDVFGATLGLTVLLSTAFISLIPISIVWPLQGGVRLLRLLAGSATLLSASVIYGRNIYGSPAPLVVTASV